MPASTAVVRARGSVPARSKRTTPRKKGLDYINVDEILESEGLAPRDVDEIPTFEMEVFGVTVRVLKTVNVLSILMFDEDDEKATAEAVRGVIDLVHPDDQQEFKAAYGRVRDLSGKALNIIIREMIRGAADPNPSSSPDGSGRTAKASTSALPSAAN